MRTCEVCEGRKTCMGMGHMRIDCLNCKGTGKIFEELKVDPIEKDNKESVKNKTKNDFKKVASAKGI